MIFFLRRCDVPEDEQSFCEGEKWNTLQITVQISTILKELYSVL